MLHKRSEKLVEKCSPTTFHNCWQLLQLFLVCRSRVPQIVEDTSFQHFQWMYMLQSIIARVGNWCPLRFAELSNGRPETTGGVVNNCEKSWESISQESFQNACEGQHAIIQQGFANRGSVYTKNLNNQSGIWNLDWYDWQNASLPSRNKTYSNKHLILVLPHFVIFAYNKSTQTVQTVQNNIFFKTLKNHRKWPKNHGEPTKMTA